MPVYTEMLDRDFIQQHNIVFRPDTEEESSYIQNKLFNMGFVWGDGTDFSTLQAETVRGQLEIDRGTIYYCEVKDNLKENQFYCTTAQLANTVSAKKYKKPMSQAEQLEDLLEKFNALSDRVNQQDKIIAKLTEQLNPQVNTIIKRREPGK